MKTKFHGLFLYGIGIVLAAGSYPSISRTILAIVLGVIFIGLGAALLSKSKSWLGE